MVFSFFTKTFSGIPLFPGNGLYVPPGCRAGVVETVASNHSDEKHMANAEVSRRAERLME